jgi:hypothetical protein
MQLLLRKLYLKLVYPYFSTGYGFFIYAAAAAQIT